MEGEPHVRFRTRCVVGALRGRCCHAQRGTAKSSSEHHSGLCRCSASSRGLLAPPVPASPPSHKSVATSQVSQLHTPGVPRSLHGDAQVTCSVLSGFPNTPRLQVGSAAPSRLFLGIPHIPSQGTSCHCYKYTGLEDSPGRDRLCHRAWLSTGTQQGPESRLLDG